MFIATAHRIPRYDYFKFPGCSNTSERFQQCTLFNLYELL